jgi:tetratricopeptide (TPR) repeat protein
MKNLKQLLKRTHDLNVDDNHDEVLERLTDEVLQAHSNAKLYQEVGYAWYRKKEPNKALFYFNKTMELEPNADAYFWRGETLLQLEEYAKAIEDFNIGIEKKNTLERPKNLSSLYCRRALCHYRLDNNKEALKDYNKSIKLDPEEGILYYWRSAVWHSLNKFDKALADVEIALKDDPEDPDYLLIRALCLDEMNENKKAMDDLNKIISIDNTYAAAYNNRAVIWSRLDQLQRSLRDCNKAIELAPEKAQYYYCRGTMWEMLKDYKNAMADYDKALELDPAHKATLEDRQALKRKMLARNFQ